MNVKKLFSVLLILSIVLSVFVMPTGVFAGTVTVADDKFVPQKHYVDFSEYELTAGSVYRTTQTATGSDIRWSLEEDETATGGKYLQLNNDSTLFSGNQVYMRQCIINPTGDYKDNGDFSNKVRLETNTSYRIKLRYKVSGLDESKYDVRFSAYATGGTTSIVASAKTENLTTFAKGIKNTTDWVTGEYVFTTPEAFADGSKRVFALTMAAYSGTSLSQVASYVIALDYVQLEKVEFKPQHMEVGFDSGVWNPASGNNGCYYTPNDTVTTEWSTVTEDENSFVQLNHVNSTTEVPRYSIMLNPTGASTWKSLTKATQDGDINKFYILEANGKYRIRFKYKLAFAEGVEAMNIPVSIMASGSSFKTGALSNASSTSVNIRAADVWTDFEGVFVYDTSTANSTKALGLRFYAAGLEKKQFTLSIDDVVVDRVAEITAVNVDGSTKTVYGAPAGFTENVCTESAAEAVILDNGSKENYNGKTATVTENEWYEDSALSNAFAADRTFYAANQVVYAKTKTVLLDTNQMAFCGFDTYNLRTHNPTPDEWTGANFSTKGWNAAEANTTFNITDADAHSGSKAMKISFDSSTNFAYRQLYIGNDYELVPGQSYMFSMWVKPTAVDGELSITATGSGDTYGRRIEGGWKTINAEDLTVGEWQRIDIMFNLDMRLKNSNSSFANYADSFFCAPTLSFATKGSCEMYLDTITISALCTDTKINVVDTDTVRVTSNYNGCDTVYLAGDIYNVDFRRVYASFEADAKNFGYKSADAANVMVINKNSSFNKCYAYNEETGMRTFSGTINGLEDNKNAILNVRASIMVRKEGSTSPSEFNSVPLTFVTGDTARGYAPAEYSLVWGDEFVGTALNTGKWSINNEKSLTSKTGGDYNKYEADGKTLKSSEQILAEQTEEGIIEVKDGELLLNVLKSDGTYGYKAPLTLWTAYTMNYRYGYIEARIKTPYTAQNRTALWFQSGWNKLANEKKCNVNSAEIDLLEIFSSDTTKEMKPNIHLWRWDSVNNRSDHLQFNNRNCIGGDVSPYGYTYSPEEENAYHIYGMEWTPTELTIYVDGVEICTYTIDEAYDKIFDMSNAPEANGFTDWSTKAYQDPICILLGAGVNSDSGNIQSQTTAVDWVRLYQKSESGVAYDGSTVKQAIWR